MMREGTWHYVIRLRTVYSLEKSREVGKSLDDDIKKHVNHIATTWCTHGALMDDAWMMHGYRIIIK